MKWLLVLLILPTILWADCENERHITSEKEVKLIFCEVEDLNVTQSCALDVKKCPIFSDLKKNRKAPGLPKALSFSQIGTSGSRICNMLGWTVSMGEMFDGSQICTCLHPKGESISCQSLEVYYRKESDSP